MKRIALPFRTSDGGGLAFDDHQVGELTTAAVALIAAVVLTVGGLLPVLRGEGADPTPTGPGPAEVGGSTTPEDVP